MASTRQLAFSDGDVMLVVGTTKGLFLLKSDRSRKQWDVGGPYFQGRSVYAAAYDGRAGKRRLWVGAQSEHWGPGLSSSDDFGKTWNTPDERAIRFPEDTGASLDQIWQIRTGRDEEPGTLYCGVQPAAIFRSTDDGESWALDRGLWEHPHRERWEPGFGGLCLHTILPHPEDSDRVTVAISTGGVYRTLDGGKTWAASNTGVRAEYLPDKYPEFGQCVHKIAHHPEHPDLLFLQNHWGLYRSDDGGATWRDIANGVPSDFGFAMAVHPHQPETVYIVPLESDGFRCTPEGKLRVYRTKDGGLSWQPLTRGLPQAQALETVLRDGMDVDALKPAGVYFGTRSGKVYASASDGDAWSLIADGLPPVVCVKVAIVGDGAGGKKAPAKTSRTKPAGRTPARKTSTGKKAAKKKKKKVTKKKATKKKASRRR